MSAAEDGLTSLVSVVWPEMQYQCTRLQEGDVAHMVERVLRKYKAMGSIPIFSNSLFLRLPSILWRLCRLPPKRCPQLGIVRFPDSPTVDPASNLSHLYHVTPALSNTRHLHHHHHRQQRRDE